MINITFDYGCDCAMGSSRAVVNKDYLKNKSVHFILGRNWILEYVQTDAHAYMVGMDTKHPKEHKYTIEQWIAYPVR